MRQDGDLRPTWLIKMQWFEEIKPDLIIDDDPEVIEKALAAGYNVLQVHGYRCTEKDSIPDNYK
jgi:hypothetical protein